MGHKILLADDSITIQKVIELTFTDEDFELHTVGNGQKAIEEIRTVKPDIVLCDIIMPEKSGYEVCEHIKTSDDLKHIPVLLLTGAFEPFDQERAKKAGCDGFLAKPFEPQTLISKVKELLKTTAGSAGTTQSREPSPSSTIGTAAVPPPAPPAAPPETTTEASDMGESTVMMSPGMVPPTPAPDSPDATASREAAEFQDNLAVEAGERELSVDSDDRTMFLGQPEEPSGGSADDIWGEVRDGAGASQSPPAPPESQMDEGQTVMMSAPIVPEPIEPATPDTPDTPDTIDPGERKDVKGPEDVPGGFTELPTADVSESPNTGTDDDAWVIPGPDPSAESAEPELTPLGDFGGFDDFSAEPSKPVTPAEPAKPAEPAQPAQPAQPVQSSEPAVPASPIQESAQDAGKTAQPWGEPASPAPTPPAPPPVAKPPAPAANDEPFAELSPETPPAKSPPPANPPTPATPATPATPVGFAQTPPEPAAEAKTPANTDVDALADQVVKKVMSQLSEKVIQEIAWEVVPDLAEALIQKEIAEIKAKIPK